MGGILARLARVQGGFDVVGGVEAGRLARGGGGLRGLLRSSSSEYALRARGRTKGGKHMSQRPKISKEKIRIRSHQRRIGPTVGAS